MRKRVAVCTVLALILGPALLPPPAGVSNGPRHMPPNEIKLIESLRDAGSIPPGASEDEAEKVLAGYLQHKIGRKPPDRIGPLASRRIQALESRRGASQALHGRKLGAKEPVPNSTPLPYTTDPQTTDVLTLLVEFTDPAHNRIAQPGPDNNTDLWVPDFDPGHYSGMLFDRSPGAKSMSNYYLEQSNGEFTVAGEVSGWVGVDHPESYYGADHPAGGIDNLNGPVWRLVADAVAAAGDSVDWARYDVEDPFDFDGDGDLNEPDGYVDHLMVAHAGAGQESGGGAQGDDAVWSHSWWADFRVGIGPGYGGVQTSNPAVWVGPYTIMPEDGTIGVFAHEFAHDLGLPDEYDTIYSGEAPTGFYTLMASGSWLGRPLGSEPSDISIWGRYALGWVDPVRVGLDDVGTAGAEITLDQAERKGSQAQAVRVDLPARQSVVPINAPYSGSQEWWSGKGDDLINGLTRAFDLTGLDSATLEFWTWYEIEQGYDFGYVQVSTDGGSWQSIPGNVTEPGDNGITGMSGGWVKASFDLGAFAGQPVFIRFQYVTDGSWQELGWAIDDISVPELGYLDDVEGGAGGWAADGWSIINGSLTRTIRDYYMLEWRNYTGFDRSLQYAYNFVGPRTVEWFSLDRGLLVWYRNPEFTDNWVGVHPGRGFLLLVDSHPAPLRTPVLGVPWRTRVQIMDAPFSTARTASNTLTRYGVSRTYPSLSPVPEFNDSAGYWNPASPDGGVIVPGYGLNFNVAGVSDDFSAALVQIYLDANSNAR